MDTYFDVSDAFGNVLPKLLLDKLDESKKMIKFSKFVTYERIFHTKVEGHEKLTVSKGVSQVGVLSSLF